MREQAQNLGQNLQQGAEQAADRVREGYDTAREEFGRRYRHAEGAVARNPAPSLLIAFGLGFGLGLALTAVLTHEEESWADRYLPDSMRNLPDSFYRMKRRGVERVREAHITDALQDSFHHLADSIRDLPTAIARMMPDR
jgi:hypothetical protein